MFTGLIETLGEVRRIKQGSNWAEITVRAFLKEEPQIGDSISINGACQTVVARTKEEFTVEVMMETLRRTNLGELKIGDKVNIERPLSLNSFLDGHLVAGHVDEVGLIIAKEKKDRNLTLKINASPDFLSFLAPLGSVAVDGISLTVGEVEGDSFFIHLIPHTVENTTLGFKGRGAKVNLEADIIARYLKRLISPPPKALSVDFLKENGFI